MTNGFSGGFASGLTYFVLDVFTETQLSGNPLAVVLNPGTLTTEAMQAIAQELNLSETTFVERRAAEVESSEGVRVRIFTTEEELPFAGHPTLGTASLLRAIAPECMTNGVVRLALNVGPVPVRFEEGQPEWPVRGEMTQRDPEFGELLDPVVVAELTGLRDEDFMPGMPIQVVSTGTGFAIVLVRSVQAMAALKVRHEEAGRYLRARGARWFYVLGPEVEGDAGTVWRARMQFNGGEDPATGSAAGCAISYLVRYKVVTSGKTLPVQQGVEMGRPSHLFLSARRVEKDETEVVITDVRVAGGTILVAKGLLFLP